MSETRARRVAEQIKKEVGRIISTEMKDPRLAALTSVTDVQVSRDLRYATIYISVYGSPEKQEETMHTITRAAGFIRSEIGRRIRLRYTPEITIEQDRSMDYGSRIDRVLKNLQDEKNEE
jgi:ribosome-binding factor A